MALDVDTLFDAMSSAAQGLATGVWSQMQTFALPELQKIAVQIVSIEQNNYPEDAAKALLDMQVRATVSVIVGMTTLVLLDVQAAINQILNAVKALVNAALPFALIP